MESGGLTGKGISGCYLEGAYGLGRVSYAVGREVRAIAETLNGVQAIAK